MKIIELHCYQPIYMPNGKMLNKVGISDNQVKSIVIAESGFLVVADWKAKRVTECAGEKEEVVCNVFVPHANVRNAVYTEDKLEEVLMEQYSPVLKVKADNAKMKVIDKKYAQELIDFKNKAFTVAKAELKKLAKSKNLYIKANATGKDIINNLIKDKCRVDGYNPDLLEDTDILEEVGKIR